MEQKVEADSPYIPGTKIQYAWDSTSLSWLKTCPRLYQYSMIEGWRSKKQNLHLEFGIIFHKAIETYDKLVAKGLDKDAAIREVLRYALLETNTEFWTPETPDPNKNRFTLIRSILWYLFEFEEDQAETKILANGLPAVELSFRFQISYDYEGFAFCLSGHLDRVAKFMGGNFVIDKKTTKGMLNQHYFEGYTPHNQMSLYTIAGQVTLSSPVSGVVIDGVRIMVGFSEFQRGMVYRTPAQLDEWMKDLRFWLDQAVTYAKNDYWPQNDTACDKFGGCVFRGVCSKDPSVRQQFLETSFERRPWNPLEPR